MNDAPPRRETKLLAWKAVRRGKLRGFAEIELPIGLRIPDVGVFEDDEGVVRARLPMKPRMRQGVHLKDDRGQFLYLPGMSWNSKALNDRFQLAVGSLVRKLYPGDFDSAEDA